MNNKESIVSGITTYVEAISTALDSCPDKLLNAPQGEKWSVAGQVTHLNKSVAPLNMAMGLPKFTFYLFGRVSFSRSYEEIKENYDAKLSSGAKASKAYVPNKEIIYEKLRLTNDFEKAYDIYTRHIDKWSESDLDTYRLPHPILGKVTLREMAFFSVYHLEHHLNTIKTLINT